MDIPSDQKRVELVIENYSRNMISWFSFNLKDKNSIFAINSDKYSKYKINVDDSGHQQIIIDEIQPATTTIFTFNGNANISGSNFIVSQAPDNFELKDTNNLKVTIFDTKFYVTIFVYCVLIFITAIYFEGLNKQTSQKLVDINNKLEKTENILEKTGGEIKSIRQRYYKTNMYLRKIVSGLEREIYFWRDLFSFSIKRGFNSNTAEAKRFIADVLRRNGMKVTKGLEDMDITMLLDLMTDAKLQSVIEEEAKEVK